MKIILKWVNFALIFVKFLQKFFGNTQEYEPGIRERL